MTDFAALAGKLDRLDKPRLLCVGDLMLDRFLYGAVDRISPEAPIPVVRVEREATMLGGAGNVVRNLVSLGTDVVFVTVVGDDAAGAELTGMIGATPNVEPYLLTSPGRRSTIKSRYIAAGQQLLRADDESGEPLSEATLGDLRRSAVDAVDSCDAVILSDYGKGVLQPEVIAAIIEKARLLGRPVIVDPKGDDFARYRGASLVTPNRRELAVAARKPTDDDPSVVAAAESIRSQCDIDAVLVTRGGDGMTLVAETGASHHMARAREVFDVSGAGDTVVATFAAAWAAGFTMDEATTLANAAAGVVVGKVGTAAVLRADLANALHRGDVLDNDSKVMPLDLAADRIELWRRQGARIGFTNGCFDLLHPGHLSLLRQARANCDRLVVGLNSDSSVSRLKGDSRPIQQEAARAIVLASLETVDLVVVFAEDTPIALIERLRPDVLVKGADYTLAEVVGGDIVQSYGGKVVLAELEAGHSTSDTVARIGGQKVT
jgi:D-beta-D-heptose 7-phosphate kinase/D-beta-D-heptose 1-phosphate adenosyltransferase